MQVTIFGLGEAGSRFAEDLVASGVTVVGYDIRRLEMPSGVRTACTAADAVAGSDLVLSLTTSEGAVEAVAAVAGHMPAGAVYADLNASAPTRKRDVAMRVPGTPFADVAILAPIARAGIRTPVMACGSGAARYAELLRPLGADVDLIDGDPGTATSRKLLRSVFMKSLATTVIEALEAGDAVGCVDWVRGQIETELGERGPALVERLVSGTYQHARRRKYEMRDTRDYLVELGRHADMTNASLAWLTDIESGRRVRVL